MAVFIIFSVFLYSLLLVYLYGKLSMMVWTNPPSTPYSLLLNLMTFLTAISYVFIGFIVERGSALEFRRKIVAGIFASIIHYPGFIGVIYLLKFLNAQLNASYQFPMALISLAVLGFPAGIILSRFLSKWREVVNEKNH